MNDRPPTPAEWSSNTDLPAIAAFLGGKRRVAVLTHVKPDGDAIGSTAAAARALNLAAGTTVAAPWYMGGIPDWAPAVLGPTLHTIVDKGPPPHADPDAILILDTGAWAQVHDVAEWLRGRTAIAAVIDHHRQGNGEIAALRYIDTGAAAVCAPVAELCRLILGAPSLRALPIEIAEPLYLGLATDTGWFRHSNVSPGALRLGAELLEAGVRHSRLYEEVEQRDRPSRLRLLARALASLEFLKGDNIALMQLTLKDFHEARAVPTDTAGFSELGLSVGAVKVSVMITEAFVGPNGKRITKVSMRAKSGPGAVDVGRASAAGGGGGHVAAAGAKMECDLAEARRRVLNELL